MMATNSPGIGYRWVGEDELIESGDEFRTSGGKWAVTGYAHRQVTPRTASGKYRRKVKAPQFAPKYAYPLAPPCPVHVLWAESPWDSPLAHPAKIEPLLSVPTTKPEPFPGEGYRLVENGELIETGDEWWEKGKWITTVFKAHHKMTKYGGLGVSPLRRKLPEPKPEPSPGAGYRWLVPGEEILPGDEGYDPKHLDANKDGFRPTSNESMGRAWRPYLIKMRRAINQAPQYRPYASADEAAKALEGKLIKHTVGIAWHPVFMVDRKGIKFNGSDIPYADLCYYYHFTDGTPCGVKIN